MSFLLHKRATYFPFLLLLFFMPSTPLPAQEEAPPLLRGEVRVGSTPLTEGVVVLHRVSAETSGEIDSVKVESDGTFRIRLPFVPDHLNRPEILFASVEYRGLFYFGPALTEAIQLDSLYLIQAYDTVSVPPGGAQIPLSSRSLFLERASDGWSVTDVFRLRLDGDRTLYSPVDGIVWAYPLPTSASDFEVGQADMPPDALRFAGGRLELYSPLPPGERFLMVRYRITQSDFLLPLPGRTDQMEVMVREPGPAVEFPPLALSSPAQLDESNVFRRYVGEGLQDVEIRTEVAPEPWSLPAEWLGLLVAGLLGGAGVFGYRRRNRGLIHTSAPAPSVDRDSLLLDIARLDEEFQAKADPSKVERQRYQTDRAELLSKLKRWS